MLKTTALETWVGELGYWIQVPGRNNRLMHEMHVAARIEVQASRHHFAEKNLLRRAERLGAQLLSVTLKEI